MINGHGNDQHNYPYTIKADFSSNVFHQDINKDLQQHLANCISSVNKYPDPNATKLRLMIASKHNINPNQIIITNGSTEAFYLLAQGFAKQNSTIFTPSFSEYEDAARIHGHSISYIANNCLPDTFHLNTNLVWIGNPNNPDGKTFSSETIRDLCHNHPHIYFVIDEAYSLLCFGFQSSLELSQLPKNLIVVRSLTKAFSIPGLRLGYLVASEDVCNNLNQLKMPWSVNNLALEAGCYILHNYEQLSPDLELILKQSHHLQNTLREINGLSVTNSTCNYFLAKTEFGSAAELKQFLLEEHGFLIRDAGNFRGLNKTHFRLAIQNETHNQKLIIAINQWISLRQS